jgi:hypothetical protein
MDAVFLLVIIVTMITPVLKIIVILILDVVQILLFHVMMTTNVLLTGVINKLDVVIPLILAPNEIVMTRNVIVTKGVSTPKLSAMTRILVLPIFVTMKLGAAFLLLFAVMIKMIVPMIGANMVSVCT